MKHFRILFPILILALLLSACGKQRLESYEYTFSSDNQVKTIRVNPEAQTILDGTDVYHYEMEASGNRTSYVIHYPNGATFHWTSSEYGGAGGWSDDYNETRYVGGNILINALEAGAPRQRSGNVGIGLLAIAMGAWHTLSPESVFYLNKGWMFKNAEPSEGYLLMTRIIGVIAIIAGLVHCLV